MQVSLYLFSDLILSNLTNYLIDYAYMAMGFSRDDRMPNSDVVGCQKSDPSTANVQDTFNVDYVNVHDDDNSAITNFTYTINGSYFFCEFNRAYVPPDSSEGFTLNDGTFFIFSAIRSDILPTSLRFERHEFTPCVSDGRIDPLALTNVTSSNPDYSLVKAHGLMMILAWSVFISTGVFIANYGKCALPNGEWFQLHKFINIFGLITALIGVALIFIYLQEWRVGSATLWAHQLIGLGSISLMVANPIIAAFRCRPNAKFRWIFRLIHGAVGYFGIALATVAIFLGLSLFYNLIDNGNSTRYGFWFYLAKLITDWLFHIPLIIYFCYTCKTGKDGKEKSIELKDINATKKEKPVELEKVNPFKLFLHNIFAPPQCPTGDKRKKPCKEWPIIISALVAFAIYNICYYIAITVVVAIAEQI